MTDTAYPPAPVPAGHPPAGPVRFAPLPVGGALLLAAAVEPAAIADPLGALLDLPVPRRPWQVVRTGPRTLCWLSPRSWLLLCDEAEEADIAARVRDIFPDRRLHACAQSSRLSLHRLHGDGAEDLLRQLGFLSLAPGGIPVGGFRRTLLAGEPTLIWRTGPDDWHLGVDRDKARHLHGWLARLLGADPAATATPAAPGRSEERARP